MPVPYETANPLPKDVEVFFKGSQPMVHHPKSYGTWMLAYPLSIPLIAAKKKKKSAGLITKVL